MTGMASLAGTKEARINLARSTAAIAFMLAASAEAQTIRGIVADDRDAPVTGVIVQLLDRRDSVVARGLSNERGEYRLTAPANGSYRVRTQRIGYRPAVYGPYELRAGADLTQETTLTGLPVTLNSVSVIGPNECRGLGDTTGATFLVWEQARLALTATQLSATARASSATTFIYERVLNPADGAVLEQNSSIRVGYGLQPWAALAPDSIHRAGYVVTDRDGSLTYHAPSLDVLLSDWFIEDHCFRIVPSPTADRVGVAFEPTPARRRIPELRGTLWVDRMTSELRALVFRYANVPRDRSDHAGGTMEFARMANGAWMVSGWEVRVPVLEQRSSVARAGRAGGVPTREIHVAEVKATGGKLLVAHRGRDTLWTRPPIALRGRVTDSTTATPLAGARISVRRTAHAATTDPTGQFTIPGVVPGAYTIEVRTASLDSVGAAHESAGTFTDAGDSIQIRVPTAGQVAAKLCGIDEKARLAPGQAFPGILAGSVAGADASVALRDVRVVVEWAAPGTGASASGVAIAGARRTRWLEARTDARGIFRICGIPVNTPLVVQADGAGGRSLPTAVDIPAQKRFTQVSLTLDSAVNLGAVFTGVIVDDSTRRPIANAEVALPGLSRSGVTNDQGGFRIVDIPAGTHRVVVRRVGYGPLDTPVDFPPDATVERRIVLTALATLETVTVTGEAPELPEFEANRRLGLGHFLTRADLERQKGRRLSDVIAQAPGVRIVPGQGNRTWLTTSRGQRSLGNAPVVDPADVAIGARPGLCYAQVYLDRTLVYAAKDGEPLFDLNTIAPDQIEAIEYYAGPSQTPLKYGGLNSTCGVLVIHTRRSP